MAPSLDSVPMLSLVSSCRSPPAAESTFTWLLVDSLDCVYCVGASAAVAAALLLLVAGWISWSLRY